MAGNFREKS